MNKTTVIIFDDYASVHADLAALFEEFRKLAGQMRKMAEELLESLPKLRPPVESGWPSIIPERAREGRPGRSTNAPVSEICGRWPSGYL
ncbi:hypothetical protein [Paremcibacter congregatus]|uniref:hypothetical protein n=1 Tax=Paremcibacter congregatus TaxID=2043170 RepID=UPI003A9443DA